MNKQQFEQEWVAAVRNIDTMRRLVSDKKDIESIQKIVVRLLFLGKRISRKMK